MAAVAVLAILTVPLTGGRLSRLTDLELRATWLLVVALGTQVVITEVPATGAWSGVFAAVHVLTYVLAAAFVVVNRRLRGLLLVALGAALNGGTIALNGGTLPASPAALAAAGRAPTVAGSFTNSGELEHARLAVLGDVFAVPAGWPLANVYSVGDVVIAVGILVTVHLACRRRDAPVRHLVWSPGGVSVLPGPPPAAPAARGRR
jgi:hypothetical protein